MIYDLFSSSGPTSISDIPAGNVLSGTFGANKTGGADTGTYAFPGQITTVSKATIQTLTVGLGLGNVASNTAIGLNVLAANTSGANNTGVGSGVLALNQSGGQNTGMGRSVLASNVTGVRNTAFGDSSSMNINGNDNTAVGVSTLLAVTSGSRNVALGMSAGKYATGSDEFYVDNRDRANTAGDKAGAIFYGVLSATPASQTLRINAAVTALVGVTSISPTVGSGYATGAGGTVTQATSKATAFTLSTVTGQITTAADALNLLSIVSAVWTNTAIAATDVVTINHVSGGTIGAYTFNVACGAGTATLTIRNATAGSLSEALVLSFVVTKGVTS